MIMNDTYYTSAPLFSIVVPAYNSAKFIDKCIDSVLKQTCSDFELILVDDGSKDDTFAICNSYAEKDSRIKVIHKDNGGHTSARNEGLKASIGSYILFLDSDDWLNVKTLELCRYEITANDSDIVIFRMKNSTSIVPFPVLVNDGYYEMGDSKILLWSNLLMGADGKFIFPKSLSAKCFKREIILGSQLSIPREVLVGEDGAAFIGAMLGAHGVSVIAGDDRACYNCLVRSDSVSRSSDINALKRVPFLLKYYRKIFDVAQFDFTQQFNRYVVASLYTATLLVVRGGGGRKELNRGLENVLSDSLLSSALKKASFNIKGYKFFIKKFILRYHLWGFARLLDRI